MGTTFESYPAPLVGNNQRSLKVKSKIPVMLHQHPSTTLRKHSLIRTGFQGEGISAPRFSIRSVNKIASGGKRTDNRKHSDDFEIRRQNDSEKENTLMKSLSMEHINKSNVICCVRDSKELLQAKLASSSSRLVGQLQDQAELLYKDIKHPKAYTFPGNTIAQPLGPVGQNKKQDKKNTSYTALYKQKQEHLSKQTNTRKRCENITKQRKENENRHKKIYSPEIVNYDHGEERTPYPHTLPSAMYQIPAVDEYPALYSGYSPLPPIHTNQSEYAEEEIESPNQMELSPPPKKDGYSVPKPKATYKPYTMKDYDGLKRTFGWKAGGLGPDTENSAYKTRLEKTKRQTMYAQKIRIEHKVTDFPKRKSLGNPRCLQPPSKTEKASQYASKIPRPKPIKRKTQLSPLGMLAPTITEKEPSLLREEILQERVRRHLQHKRILEDLEKL